MRGNALEVGSPDDRYHRLPGRGDLALDGARKEEVPLVAQRGWHRAPYDLGLHEGRKHRFDFVCASGAHKGINSCCELDFRDGAPRQELRQHCQGGWEELPSPVDARWGLAQCRVSTHLGQVVHDAPGDGPPRCQPRLSDVEVPIHGHYGSPDSVSGNDACTKLCASL